MVEVERYSHPLAGGLYPKKDGRWVRYEDHKKIVGALVKELYDAQADAASWEQRYRDIT